MTPFLYRVAKAFYLQYGSQLYKHTFVFPNRRAAMFFQKYLAEIAGRPLFSPTMITIQELFASLSSYQPADRIDLLVTLYNHYQAVSGSSESFDDFLFWGEMLLNDFDDVDKFMVDAGQLFRNIYNLKSLDDDLTHLEDSQIEAIRRFWKNFMPVEGNETKEKFQETWKVLFDLYESFRNNLQENGRVYEGMMFREVVERAKDGHLFNQDSSGYIFVGFNALTLSEIKLMEYLRDSGLADFYWDYDSPLIRDNLNRASFWVKDNLNRFPSKLDIDYALASPTDIEAKLERGADINFKTNIEVIGVPSGVGQAKHLSHILSDLIKSGLIPDSDEAINTAVVLPDESLLLPVLYSIPEQIGKINVTMGYSLSHSSISSLVEHIALLQQNQRNRNGEPAFYHRYVKAILNHPLVTLTAKNEANELKEHIVNYNRIVITASEIPENKLLQQIFTPVTDLNDIANYMHSILKMLYSSLTADKQSLKESEKKLEKQDDNQRDVDVVNSGDTRSIDLEREFIVQYYKTITRLKDKLSEQVNISVDTFFRLLRKMAQSISVSFRGEPLSGLQIMGVLETRAIDFDNIIILSMNEGVFPLKSSANSFIPYTLRKGFGLPTYEHQDSIYAYNFYRMISRARNVYMLYDTRSEGIQTGEVSRYFYQIKYLYHNSFNITERVVAYDVTTHETETVVVEKSPEVMQKLNEFRRGGSKALSASVINNYIDCPLKFYFTAVEGLSEESEVQESIEFDVFGSIFHRLMEIIYARYINRDVTPDVLSEIIKDDKLLTEILEKAFARYYFMDEHNPRPLEGQYYLIGEILKSYVKQTLKADKQFTPFTYLNSEYSFGDTYKVNKDLHVNFKGIIDRIDRVGDSVRIIDYKSGTGETSFKEFAQLFDSSKDRRPYQILQVFIYGLFYLLKNPGVKVSPAIYYLRSVFQNFSPVVHFDKHPIEDISIYMPEFKEMFDNLIEEIFNPTVPFTQTQNDKNCQWCPFKELCGK